MKQIATKNLNLIWQLDNHQLRIFDYDEDKNKVESDFYVNRSLCSENYLLAFYYDKDEKIVKNAWLFQRKSGLPVAKFDYDKDEKFKIQQNEIKQFELVLAEKKKNENSQSYLILRTEKGEIRLPLDKREYDIYR